MSTLPEMPNGGGDDALVFAPEHPDHEPVPKQRRPWRVLIIDDAPEVHSVTRMVLKDVRFQERPVEFLSAYSAAEGRRLLAGELDIAVVFLDVVMESDDAGLKLVEYIRGELGKKEIRIVLRTGQPGQAPETDVIVRYDINDYKHKSELSAERLFTTMISALRSYQDLVTIETSRQGLRRIIEGTALLFQTKSSEQFLSGVLMQMNAIFRLGDDALLYVRGSAQGAPQERIMAASGRYLPLVGLVSNETGLPPQVQAAIRSALALRKSCYEPEHFSIYFYAGARHELVVYVDAGRELNALDIEMIEIFCSSVALGLENVQLLESLEARVVERTRELAAANENLRTMAMTDPLTGAFNRRHVMDVAEKLFSAGKRYGHSLAVLLIDVDHFKRINDTCGHSAGDEVLKRLAHDAQACLRDADIFGRIGGEEFVVVAPHTDLQAAQQLAARLMDVVARGAYDWEGRRLALTVSIGIAPCLPADASLQTVIDRADRAMYWAKQQGRNRAVADTGC